MSSACKGSLTARRCLKECCKVEWLPHFTGTTPHTQLHFQSISTGHSNAKLNIILFHGTRNRFIRGTRSYAILLHKQLGGNASWTACTRSCHHRNCSASSIIFVLSFQRWCRVFIFWVGRTTHAYTPWTNRQITSNFSTCWIYLFNSYTAWIWFWSFALFFIYLNQFLNKTCFIILAHVLFGMKHPLRIKVIWNEQNNLHHGWWY